MVTIPTDRAVISVSECARVLGLSPNATYAAIARNEIPWIKIGRRILVPCDRLRALLERGLPEGLSRDEARDQVHTQPPRATVRETSPPMPIKAGTH